MTEAFDPHHDGDDGDAGNWLDSLPPEQYAALIQLLEISAKQIDDGDYVEFDVEKLLAEGRARRAAEAQAAAA